MIETVEMAISNDIEKIKNFFGYRAD
jgi:hypothetical protein